MDGSRKEALMDALQDVDRAQVLRHRIHVQQLDRTTAPDPTDAAVLDLGVQDTGPDGAPWALALRGAPVTAGDPPTDLALMWSARGAPHAYRRTDVPEVARALVPWSETDGARRVYDASKPLRAAGIGMAEALVTVARAMRQVVEGAGDVGIPKGELSTAMTGLLPEPYLRWCRGCGATHCYEMTFRLGALHAGLELVPGTSPPVLRAVEPWPAGHLEDLAAAMAAGPSAAEAVVPRLDPLRGYLHLVGPARPADVAAYLDAPVKDVLVRWRALEGGGELVTVEVDGEERGLLAVDVDALRDAAHPRTDPVVRLVGPYDLFLQARDRELLVPEKARHKSLWPVLGRPGAVLADGEVVGTWRPRASGRRLRIALDPWVLWDHHVEAGVDEQVARLGEHRGAAESGRA